MIKHNKTILKTYGHKPIKALKINLFKNLDRFTAKFKKTKYLNCAMVLNPLHDNHDEEE